MLHDMRSISEHPAGETTSADSGAAASVEAILTEVSSWVSDLRCASMGRLVQSHVSLSHMHVLWLLQHHGGMTMSRVAALLDVSLSHATGRSDRIEVK